MEYATGLPRSTRIRRSLGGQSPYRGAFLAEDAKDLTDDEVLDLVRAVIADSELQRLLFAVDALIPVAPPGHGSDDNPR